MDKIIQTVKRLYSDADAGLKHWGFALLLLFPAITSTAFNLIDKTNSNSENHTLLIMGTLCLIVAVPAFVAIYGFYLKFINNKFNDTNICFPRVNVECFKRGFKAIPLFLVWSFYYILLIILMLTVVLACAYAISVYKNETGLVLLLIASIFASFAGTFLLMLFLYPFVQLIFVKYAKNFKYNAEMFNPLTPFIYMKKIFKPVIITSLKYVLASFLLNLVAYIVAILVLILVNLFTIALKNPNIAPNIVTISDCLEMAFLAWGISYLTQILGFAYTDNICEIYKDNESLFQELE